VTVALESVWNGSRVYAPIASRLREAIDSSGAGCIVDLCSGGGGPWLSLYGDVAGGDVAGRSALPLCLTDKYPNAQAFSQAAHSSNGAIAGYTKPVDATRLPASLRGGFRTLFSSFHHFPPQQAAAMLADAFTHREGIGVFEVAQNNTRTLLATLAVPLLALRHALRMRPFCRRRFFWTWLVPVVPLILWIDGTLSCLRSYSQEDLRELTRDLNAPGYRWHIGEERRGLTGILYLIGTPVSPAPAGIAAVTSAQVVAAE
jgi:hypothetical protein